MKITNFHKLRFNYTKSMFAMMLNKINKVRNYLYVLLLGLILRFVSINQSFWLDEATSALTVRDLDLTEIFTRFSPPSVLFVFKMVEQRLWSVRNFFAFHVDLFWNANNYTHL